MESRKGKFCHYCKRPPVRTISINVSNQGSGWIDVCIFHFKQYKDRESSEIRKEILSKVRDRELRDFIYKKEKPKGHTKSIS